MKNRTGASSLFQTKEKPTSAMVFFRYSYPLLRLYMGIDGMSVLVISKKGTVTTAHPKKLLLKLLTMLWQCLKRIYKVYRSQRDCNNIPIAAMVLQVLRLLDQDQTLDL